MKTRALCVVAVVMALSSCKIKGDAVGSDAAATATPSSDITFVKATPKPGTKLTAANKMHMKFTFGGKVFRETEEQTVTVDVQASDEFRVTKAALDVKELFSTKQEGTGDEKKSVNPLAGSRFVVTRTDDGKLSALDSGGGKVGAAQLKELHDHYADVFEKDKAAEFLPNRPLKIGEKLVPSTDSVLDMIGIKDDGKTTVDGVEFILKSATADQAEFAVSFTFTQKIDGGLRLRAKLEGTIGVNPKGSRITTVSLKGPLTILDGKGDDKGSGDLSLTGTET